MNAREVRGSGVLDASGVGCFREEGKGGEILVAATEVQRIQILSDGAPGADGAPSATKGIPLQAENGRSQAKWSFDWGESFRGKLCVTELGCRWDKAEFPKKQAADNLALLGGSRLVNVNKIHEAIGGANDFCRAWYCWVSGEKNIENHQHLFLKWKVGLDTSALHGKDATKYVRGNDGARGGDAGPVTIVSLKEDIASISSQGGIGGTASGGFCQEPGKGAELRASRYSTHEIMAGFDVVCAKNERDLGGNPYMYFCSSSQIAQRVALEFVAGRDRATPDEDSEILGSGLTNRGGKFFGRDGVKTYQAVEASDGEAGEWRIPKRRILSDIEEYARVLEDECPDCLLPKSIEVEVVSLRDEI